MVLAELHEQAVADPNKICDLICRCGEVFLRNMSAGVGEILILFLAFITGHDRGCVDSGYPAAFSSRTLDLRLENAAVFYSTDLNVEL